MSYSDWSTGKVRVPTPGQPRQLLRQHFKPAALKKGGVMHGIGSRQETSCGSGLPIRVYSPIYSFNKHLLGVHHMSGFVRYSKYFNGWEKQGPCFIGLSFYWVTQIFCAECYAGNRLMWQSNRVQAALERLSSQTYIFESNRVFVFQTHLFFGATMLSRLKRALALLERRPSEGFCPTIPGQMHAPKMQDAGKLGAETSSGKDGRRRGHL